MLFLKKKVNIKISNDYNEDILNKIGNILKNLDAVEVYFEEDDFLNPIEMQEVIYKINKKKLQFHIKRDLAYI